MSDSDISNKEYHSLTGYNSGYPVIPNSNNAAAEPMQLDVRRRESSSGNTQLVDNYDVNFGDLRAWRNFSETENINTLFNNMQNKHPLENHASSSPLKTTLIQEALQSTQSQHFQIDQVFFSRLMDKAMQPNSYWVNIVNSVSSSITSGNYNADVFADHVAPRSHLQLMLKGYNEHNENGEDTPCVHWRYPRFQSETNDFNEILQSVGCVFSVTSIMKEHPENLRGQFCGVAYRSPDDVQAKRSVSGACLMCIWLRTYTRFSFSNSTTNTGGKQINLNRFRVITGVKGEFYDDDCVNVDSSRVVTLFGSFPIWKDEMFKPSKRTDNTPSFDLMYPVFHERGRKIAYRPVDPFVMINETVDYASISLYSLLRISKPTELGLEGEFLIPWHVCLQKVKQRLITKRLFQDDIDKYNILFKNWFKMDKYPFSDSGFHMWIDACDFPECTAEYSIFWTYSMRIRAVHYVYGFFKLYDVNIFNTLENTLRTFTLAHRSLFELMKTFPSFPTDNELLSHPRFLLVDPDYCVSRQWKCDPVLTVHAVSHISVYAKPMPIDTILKYTPQLFPNELCNSTHFKIAFCRQFADSVTLLKLFRPNVSDIFNTYGCTVSPAILFKEGDDITIETHSIALTLYIRVAYAYFIMNSLIKNHSTELCFCVNKNGATSFHSVESCKNSAVSSKKGDSITGRSIVTELEQCISNISDNITTGSFIGKDSSVHRTRRVLTYTGRKLLYALKLYAYTHLDLLCAAKSMFGESMAADKDIDDSVLLENYPSPDRVLHAGALNDMRTELESILLFNRNQTSLEFKRNPYWMVLNATAITNTNKKQFTTNPINTYIRQNLEFKKWITTLLRVSFMALYPHSISIVPIEIAMHWHRSLGGYGKEISPDSLCISLNRRKTLVRLCLQEYQVYMCSRSVPLMTEICRRFNNIRQLMCNVIYTAAITNTLINSQARLNNPVKRHTIIKYMARRVYMVNIANSVPVAKDDSFYSCAAKKIKGCPTAVTIDLNQFDYQCIIIDQDTKQTCETSVHEKPMRHQISIFSTIAEDIGGLAESFIQHNDVIYALPSVRLVHPNKILEYIRSNFVSTDSIKKNSNWIYEYTRPNNSVDWNNWTKTALSYFGVEDPKTVLKEELLNELSADRSRGGNINSYPTPVYIPSSLKRSSDVLDESDDSSSDEEDGNEGLGGRVVCEPQHITRAQCIQPLKRLQELQVNCCLPTPGNPCAMVFREVAPTTLYCLELLVSMLCPGDPFDFLWLSAFGFSAESISVIRAAEDALMINPQKQPIIRFDVMTPYERSVLFALSSYMIQHSSMVNVSIQCKEYIENQVKVLERIHRCPRSQLKPCNGNAVFSTRSARCCNAIYLTSIGCKDVISDNTRITNPVLIDGDRRTRAKYLTQTMPRKCISVPLVGQAVCFPAQLYSQPTKMTTRMPMRPKTQFSRNGRIGRVGDGGFGSIHKQAPCTPGALPMFFFGRNLQHYDHAAVSPPLPLGYSGPLSMKDPLSSKGNGYIPKDYKYCGNNKIRNLVMADCCGCFIRLSRSNFGPWENSVVWCGMCPNSYNMRWIKPCCDQCKQLFDIDDESVQLRLVYAIDPVTFEYRTRNLCYNC